MGEIVLLKSHKISNYSFSLFKAVVPWNYKPGILKHLQNFNIYIIPKTMKSRISKWKWPRMLWEGGNIA